MEIKCQFKQKDTADKGQRLLPRFYIETEAFTLPLYAGANANVCLQCKEVRLVYLQDNIIVDVKNDDEFCSNLVDKCEDFFLSNVLPELLTHNFENGVIVNTETLINSVDDEPYNVGDVWCFCQETKYGRMIECRNEDCPTKYFHYECVNISCINY